MADEAARQAPVAGGQGLSLRVDEEGDGDGGALLRGFEISIGGGNALLVVGFAEQCGERWIKGEQTR